MDWYIGQQVSILGPYRSDLGCRGVDEITGCCGWVRQLCDEDLLIEIKGGAGEYYVPTRRIKVPGVR